MISRALHPWDVTPREARGIQIGLRDMLDPVWDGREVRTLAAADVGFPDKRTVRAAVVVLSFPQLEVIETAVAEMPCTFPYVPGLLAFREIPGLLSALERITSEPDVLMCDGQGIAHRQRMGLAAHAGIVLDRPVLGCAKSVLYGTFEDPPAEKGSFSYMYSKEGEVIGAAVRTRTSVKPVYVSVGNQIDLEKSMELVLASSPTYRIPVPLRLAHKLSVGEPVRAAGVGKQGTAVR